MKTEMDTIGRTAIMQPYFFPYIGYYQMAAAVEQFLFYDDVQYIKGGHIARNKLLINGKEWLFTVPLSGASPNQLIQDVYLDEGKWPQWKDKFLRTIDQNYRKADNFVSGRELLDEVLELPDHRIATLAERSVRLLMERLGRPVRFQRTSEMDLRKDLRFEERLFHICAKEGIDDYIQSQGGTTLYSTAAWRAKGLSLRFIRPTSMEYPRKGHWVPGLSMLDAILHVPFEELNTLLDKYELFTN